MVPKSFTIFWGEELIEGEEGAIYYLLRQENGKKIRCRKLLDDTETAACSQSHVPGSTYLQCDTEPASLTCSQLLGGTTHSRRKAGYILLK